MKRGNVMKQIDKIKKMDIDELAQFICEIVNDCCSDCPCEDTKFCRDEDPYCEENIKDWLKSEEE
jgi:hypothetical protein